MQECDHVITVKKHKQKQSYNLAKDKLYLDSTPHDMSLMEFQECMQTRERNQIYI